MYEQTNASTTTQYYVIYNTITGEIFSTTVSNAENISANLPNVADYAYINGKHYNNEGWINNGVFVEYTNQQKIEKSKFPDYVAKWSNQTMTWTDQRPVTEQKQSKKDQITRLRETKNLEPITYENTLFDCDETAQRNIQAWTTNINAGTNPPEGFVWRDYNNTDHAADAAFVLGLNAAVVARGTQLYQTSWTKKLEVDALTTVEQVNAYDITVGW